VTQSSITPLVSAPYNPLKSAGYFLNFLGRGRNGSLGLSFLIIHSTAYIFLVRIRVSFYRAANIRGQTVEGEYSIPCPCERLTLSWSLLFSRV
jgi:hypothetical protein